MPPKTKTHKPAGLSASPRERALAILAGSPNGATEHLLATLGIDRKTLDALVADGTVRTRVATMAAPRNLKVTWYFLVR